MRILTAAESRALDRRAGEIGIPALLLMENAALGLADAIGARYPSAERVAILCGPGNNGGDGLALARQLATRGYDVAVAVARLGRALSPEAATQRTICEGLGLTVAEVAEGSLPEAFDAAEVTVDALFGTGLTRPLAGEAARLVKALVGLGRPVVAVDLPSGLDADRARPIGPAVAADLTVTFAAPKPAHVLDPAAELCGEVVVADLGIPLETGGGPGTLHLLVGDELAAWLTPRAADAHKGRFGHLLVVAGSRGMAGAAVLAARSAAAAGAGLVTVATAADCLPELAAGAPEAMAVPLPLGAGGALDPAAGEVLLAAAAARSAAAVGPGVGRAEGTRSVLRRFVLGTDRPLVLDADGLAAFDGDLAALAARPAPTVLTPHPGELARLLGKSVEAVQEDRLAAAREAAATSGAVVVLKGSRSIVAAPDGEAWVNTTGNPAMASGGSGDVLTGLLGARLAQGEEAAAAAALAVHWHGLAGDLAVERRGGPALPAGVLAEAIPEAYARLLGG